MEKAAKLLVVQSSMERRWELPKERLRIRSDTSGLARADHLLVPQLPSVILVRKNPSNPAVTGEICLSEQIRRFVDESVEG